MGNEKYKDEDEVEGEEEEDCGGEGEVLVARGVAAVGGPWLIPTLSPTKPCKVSNRVFSSVYLLFPSSTISSSRVRVSCKESRLLFNSAYFLFPSSTATSRWERRSHSLQIGREKKST